MVEVKIVKTIFTFFSHFLKWEKMLHCFCPVNQLESRSDTWVKSVSRKPGLFKYDANPAVLYLSNRCWIPLFTQHWPLWVQVKSNVLKKFKDVQKDPTGHASSECFF